MHAEAAKVAAHGSNPACACYDRSQHRHFEGFPVVGVDLRRSVQFGCGSGEFAEHQDTVVGDPAGYVFGGDQVHSVAQRGDQPDVNAVIHRTRLSCG